MWEMPHDHKKKIRLKASEKDKTSQYGPAALLRAKAAMRGSTIAQMTRKTEAKQARNVAISTPSSRSPRRISAPFPASRSMPAYCFREETSSPDYCFNHNTGKAGQTADEL